MNAAKKKAQIQTASTGNCWQDDVYRKTNKNKEIKNQVEIHIKLTIQKAGRN